MQNNLTNLDNVIAWLNVSTIDDNVLLTRLIGSASRAIHAYLERPNLFQHVCSEVYDGSGSRRQMLRQWPVLAVGSLAVGTQAITAAPGYGQSGYSLEPWDGYPPGGPQAINLCGYSFCQGLGNVAVSYTAGYVVQNEAQTVPVGTNNTVAVNAPYGTWGADQGVSFANGGSLSLVTGTPSVGQYAVAKGIYTFAAADAGKGVLISYSFIPGDIEQACLEMIGERYRTRDRIGEKSKSLGGQETVSFNTAAMNDYVRELLQPFKRVILC